MKAKMLLRGVLNFCRRNSTKILTVTAIASEAAGFYCMHKEAPIVRDRLDDLPEDAKWYEKAKVALPVYLPAIFCFTVSSGSMVGSLVAGEKKVAEITSLYSVTNAIARKTEEKLIEAVGPEKAKEVQKKVTQEILDENPIEFEEAVELTGKGNVLFFDPYGARYFRSSRTAVLNDFADLRTFISERCWASYNDLYSCLGIRESGAGAFVGWNIHHSLNAYLDEGHSSTGELCWIIRHINEPLLGNGKDPKPIDSCDEALEDYAGQMGGY